MLDLYEPRVGQVVASYLSDLVRRVDTGDLAPLTLTGYEKALRLGVMSYFASHTLGEVTAPLAIQMRDAVRQTRGPAIANQCVYMGRRLYRYAALQGMWPWPCPFVPVPRCPERGRRLPVEPESALRVVDYCRDVFAVPRASHVVEDVQAAYFLWLLATGIRRSEGTAQQHLDVDHERRVLRIEHHKTSRRNGAKVLHLNDQALELARQIRDAGWHPIWMFPSRRRSRSGHIEDPLKAWKRLCGAVGLPSSTRLHDIRHGFAEAVYEVSGDLKAVQGLMAYRSISTAAHYVGRPKARTSRPVANAAAQLLFGGGR